MQTIEDLIKRLKESLGSESYDEVAEEVATALEGQPNAIDAIRPVLRIMENNPDVDFGAPGPLVHFVESFFQRGYEELLVRSVKRSPTAHTVWMLNRVINGSGGGARERLIQVLNGLQERTDLAPEVLDLVREFGRVQRR